MFTPPLLPSSSPSPSPSPSPRPALSLRILHKVSLAANNRPRFSLQVHDNAEELQRVSRGVPQWHSRSSRQHEPPASSFTGALASMRQLSGTIAYVLEDMERQNEEAQGTLRNSGPPPPPTHSPFNRYGDKKEEERTQGPAVRLPTPKFLPAVVEPPQRRQPRHVCQRCRATETPKWRRGPDGQRSLCNVCGLMFAKQVERVTRR